MNGWGLGEIERRLANMVKVGTISAVDHATKRIRVQAGDMNSAWLPWPVEMGRNFKRWRPLRTGQQVVMVAPSGELAQAAVIGMLYTGSLDAPSTNPDLDLVLFDDGTSVQYDSAAHQLDVDLGTSSLTMNRDSISLASNGSTIELDAAGIRLNGARIDLN